MKRTALLRRTRLRPVSKKRAKEGRTYSELRKEFLAANAWCLVVAGKRTTEIHHTAGRSGANYLDVSTWMAVSREGHVWIHAHPKESRARGWLT